MATEPSDSERFTKPWLSQALDSAKTVINTVFPVFDAADAAKEAISDVVAQRIREEARAKAYAVLADTHRKVLFNIIWQNGLLLASLVPVYLLRSAVPFILAYACVVAGTMYSIVESRHIILRLFRTRSVVQTLAHEIREAIEAELTQRGYYVQKVVEWLGPDLKEFSVDVARMLKPDVLAAAVNMAFTLFMAFLAFRVFAIPLLEQHALLH